MLECCGTALYLPWHLYVFRERSLLDGFQDLNKMFGLKHKRTESPSWKRLLASLQVDARHSVGVCLYCALSAVFTAKLPQTGCWCLATEVPKSIPSIYITALRLQGCLKGIYSWKPNCKRFQHRHEHGLFGNVGFLLSVYNIYISPRKESHHKRHII